MDRAELAPDSVFTMLRWVTDLRYIKLWNSKLNGG
jgi:hypothetical protein